MTHTLEALDRAAVASPQDRTVRLVHADALDEAGAEADAARAEFVRAQIALEAIPAGSPRAIVPRARCRELFAAHWLDWWRPVCAAAGLPEPHVPGRRARDRLARAAGRRPRRARNWPYVPAVADTTLLAEPYGLAVTFVGGFPEEVRFQHLDTPEGGPELVHRWGDALPLTRLTFASYLTPNEWDRVAGPHLARLPELNLERLSPETAEVVAACPHLAALTRLTARPTGADPGAVRALVSYPAWAGLRSLTVAGRVPPAAVQSLAAGCTLEDLEELDLTLGDPGEFGVILSTPISAIIQTIQAITGLSARWADFAPAVEALAAARWVRRLRRLTLRASVSQGVLSVLHRLRGSAGGEENVLPDGAVLSLADALAPDKLERLVLPAAVVGPAARDALAARLGDRLVLA